MAHFVPGRATITAPGQKAVRVYQMTPNLVDPGNLPEEGFTGPLV